LKKRLENKDYTLHLVGGIGEGKGRERGGGGKNLLPLSTFSPK